MIIAIEIYTKNEQTNLSQQALNQLKKRSYE